MKPVEILLKQELKQQHMKVVLIMWNVTCFHNEVLTPIILFC